MRLVCLSFVRSVIGIVALLVLASHPCNAQGLGTIELLASHELGFLPVYAADPFTHEPVEMFSSFPDGSYQKQLDVMLTVGDELDLLIGGLTIEGDMASGLRIKAKLMDIGEAPLTGLFFFSAIVSIDVDSELAGTDWLYGRSSATAFGGGSLTNYPSAFNVHANHYLLTPNDFYLPDLSTSVTITDPNQSTVSSIVSAVPDTPGPIDGVSTQLDVNVEPFASDEELFAWSEMQFKPLLNPWSDHNGDGKVDAADFAMFRNWFVPGGTDPSPLQNDPTPESVDLDDYDSWRTHYGESVPIPPAPPANAAPAPGALAMSVYVLLMLGWRSRETM